MSLTTLKPRWGGSKRGPVRRVGRACALALAGLIPVAVIGFIGGPASADGPGISLIGEVSLHNSQDAQDHIIMMDPGARRLIYWSDSSELRSYDLDTRKEVASIKQLGTNSAFPWALDADKHILFHFDGSGNLLGVDTRNLKTVMSEALPTGVSADSNGAFFWSKTEGVLYFAYQELLSKQTWIAAIDPYASTTAATVKWRGVVQGCGGLVQDNSVGALGETRDGKYLVTVCNNLSPQPSGQVAMFPLPSDPSNGGQALYRPQGIELYPGLITGGNLSGEAVWVPSLDRMLTLVESNAGAGWSAYVFDATTRHFVSAPGLFVPPSDGNIRYDIPTIGVDPASGRFFAADRARATTGRDPSSGAPCQQLVPEDNTVVIGEAAIDGASPFRFPAGDPNANGVGRVAGYDPVAHNWWMFDLHNPPASNCSPDGSPDDSLLFVYHDTLPAAVAPPRPDPDAATQDIPEVSGSTSANASSDASAYGLRYVLGPSGTEGVMTNTTGAAEGTCDINAYVSQTFATAKFPLAVNAPPLSPQYHAFCNSDGRTATFAHVNKVALDGSEARASAVTGDTDNETARDLSVGTDFSEPGLYADAVNGFVNDTSNGGASALYNTKGYTGPTPTPPSVPPPCGTPAPTPTPTPTPASTPSPPLMYTPTPPPNEATWCDQQLQPAQPYVTGLSLPYAPADCGDNGGGTGEDTPTPQSSRTSLQWHGLPQGDPITDPGSASVECSYGLQKAEGYADQSDFSIGGPLEEPVSATTALAHAVVTRNADGSIATATSTVKDISVGGFLHIASITAMATARAHGRPGTNQPSYDCTVTGVTVTMPNGITLPDGVSPTIKAASCSDPNDQGYQQLNTLISTLNVMLTGQVHIEFPRAYTSSDNPPGGAAGVVERQTPKGYLSEVALSELDQEQNSIITNDTSIEKPAMVVTYYLDNAYSRNHMVASFAAVAATARYGIFPLGEDGPIDNGLVPPLDGGLLSGPTTPATAPTITGFPTPPVTPAAVSTPRHFSLGQVAQAIIDGFRLLFQHPELIPPVLAVWLLFMSPGYLLSRRRALLSATEGAV